MGLAGAGRKVGRHIGNSIARYAEEEAQKQRAMFKEREYWCSLSSSKRQQIIENIEWQREFDDIIFKNAERLDTYPIISGLDLRRGH